MTKFEDNKKDPSWFVDSGATKHVTGNKSVLTKVTPKLDTAKIKIAGGHEFSVERKGNVNLKQLDGEVKSLQNVTYVPGVKKHLLSVGALTDKGYTLVFNSKQCVIFDKDNPKLAIAIARRDPRNKLYRMDGVTLKQNHKIEEEVLYQKSSHLAEVHSVDIIKKINLWHRHLGNVNFQSLSFILVTGIPALSLIQKTT